MRALEDIEEIKQLKARYCFLVDTKRWADWRALFTDDCTFDFPLPFGPDVTPDEFVAGAASSLDKVRSVHQVHSPVIDLLGPDSARGVWAMFDWLELPPDHPASDGHPHRLGYGYYEEEYRRESGSWRIAFMRLTRLRVDRLGPDALVPVDDTGTPPDPASWLGSPPRPR
jgi:hypothetical protein